MTTGHYLATVPRPDLTGQEAQGVAAVRRHSWGGSWPRMLPPKPRLPLRRRLAVQQRPTVFWLTGKFAIYDDASSWQHTLGLNIDYPACCYICRWSFQSKSVSTPDLTCL